MGLERTSLLPFEYDPSNKAGDTVVLDRESLFTTRSPEHKTPQDYLEDFYRDIAALTDIHGVAFFRGDRGILIEPVITTNTSTPSGNGHLNEILNPTVNTAIDTLENGLGLGKTYKCNVSITPENLRTATEAYRRDSASRKDATLLRLVLFK